MARAYFGEAGELVRSVPQRVLPALNVLARVAVIFSLTLLLPIAIAWWGDDAGLHPFLEALGLLLPASLGLIVLTRDYQRELNLRDGFVLVVGLWTVLPAAAALPLLLHDPAMGIAYAYFEASSALTTNGATAMAGLDQLPPSINLWRHLLNWQGGMGILVLAVAILPMLGVGGMQLYKAETPGPIKDAKLTPRIRETARNLWLIYAGLTVACALLLKYLGGMDWFDAVCHAFATLSLGGFSTRDAGIGHYDSPVIEIILIVFMLLAAINFATHYLALSSRRLPAYWRDSECKAMLCLILAGTLLLAGVLVWRGTYAGYDTALRHVAFNLVSLATTSGFASTDYGQWPLVVPLAMLFLSCFTACAGSTGGGIKMLRTIVLVREAGRQFVTLLHPNAVRPLRVNGNALPGQVLFAVLGFIFLYFMSAACLTFAMLLTGLDLLSSLTAVIACLNNAGPGLGVVGPAANYGVLSETQIWICTFAMLLGRLEIVSVLVLFTPAFWRS
ncbi:TrkH family potassium uptake protein [Chitiniphilus purpureus]|uniref:Trk system potassium uptake protein n=1 Tax=Chitiniphilus purpureus TaxID=2981137 RepID=A0ABY6DM06_9NEIS|nr:potassium transporter TrkG [Chitiniphilus sp. CD1]UXY15047.1 TrkH family potassium uptake protein [Chitiniphilus sp. CD1]